MNTNLRSSLAMRILIAFMISVIIITFMPTQCAFAASAKAYKNVEISNTPVSCQNLYLWTENVEKSDGLYSNLFCSKKSDGSNAVCIADTALLQVEHVYDEGYYPPQNFRNKILTNGTWIYFLMLDTFDDTARLYKVKYNSSKPALVAEIPNGGSAQLLTLYNNRIYFQCESSQPMNTDRSICSVSLSSAKIKTHRSKVDVFSPKNSSSSRYIYYRNNNFDSSNFSSTMIYDCKEGTSSNLGRTESHCIVNGKLYYAKPVSSTSSSGFKIYKANLSGRGTKTKVVTLKSASSIGTINSSFVYWKKYDGSTVSDIYYRYSFKTKTSKRISESDYKFYY